MSDVHRQQLITRPVYIAEYNYFNKHDFTQF